MTARPFSSVDGPDAATVRGWVALALTVTFLLATFGGFGLGVGVMTACTNDYSCTATVCAPCATANTWVTAGWAAQAVLFGVAVVLAVLASPRVRPRAVTAVAQAVPSLGLALLVLAGVLASASY